MNWYWMIYNEVIRKVTLSFTPYPLFQWYLQSKEIFIKSQYEMLKLRTRFNGQGSRVIIVAIEIGPVNIYVTAVEALRKKGKRG
jgi:hypothetical protein